MTPDSELSGKAAKKARKKRAKAAKARKDKAVKRVTWTDALRVAPASASASCDPHSTPGFTGDKADGKEVMSELQARLGDLQERLFAESKGGGRRSVLLVLQGIDTSGKGGTVKPVFGSVNPAGLRVTSFKAPARNELERDYLWRVHANVPANGEIGVFDRSHYEDVLAVRVLDLVPEARWRKRYAQINDFERVLVDRAPWSSRCSSTSREPSRRPRLGERLERATSTGSSTRATSTSEATGPTTCGLRGALETSADRCRPVVRGARRQKWYARLAVTNLLLEALEAMDPKWPAADYDVEEQKERLALTP